MKEIIFKKKKKKKKTQSAVEIDIIKIKGHGCNKRENEFIIEATKRTLGSPDIRKLVDSDSGGVDIWIRLQVQVIVEI